MIVRLTYVSKRDLVRDIVELVHFATLRDSSAVASAFADVLQDLESLHAEIPERSEILRMYQEYCQVMEEEV